MPFLVVACRPCNGRGVVPDPASRDALVFCGHCNYRGRIEIDVDESIAELESQF
jgi:hypothetical protein